MNIGIIGLGLIGGSIAKAIKKNSRYKVMGADIQEPVVKRALSQGAIDGELKDERLSECDLVIVALYPNDTVEFIRQKGRLLKGGTIVVDCCGVKQNVCNKIQPMARELGIHFIGGHPMAGIEYSGFDHSDASIFEGASMILTPFDDTNSEVINEMKQFYKKIGFGHVEITTPSRHDQIIAFTSQLAHVVSNAFVKSPVARAHKGFSAGSYQDLTRVAKLNALMWTELFIENKKNLTEEIGGLVDRLLLYKNAIENEDFAELQALLAEGTDRKIKLDN